MVTTTHLAGFPQMLAQLSDTVNRGSQLAVCLYIDFSPAMARARGDS